MRKKTLERTLAKAFAEFAAEFPVAKGSLTKTHSPCVRRGCRLCAEGMRKLYPDAKEGDEPYRRKLRGLYVRPGHEAALRAAIENGRELERLLVEAGRDLVLGWRGRDDAK